MHRPAIPLSQLPPPGIEKRFGDRPARSEFTNRQPTAAVLRHRSSPEPFLRRIPPSHALPHGRPRLVTSRNRLESSTLRKMELGGR